MAKCYVYFMQSDQSRSRKPVKIGISHNPLLRMSELQVGNPCKLTILTTIEFKSRSDAEMAEKFLHRRLKNMNVRGEWFYAKHGKLMQKVNKAMREKSTLVTSKGLLHSSEEYFHTLG